MRVKRTGICACGASGLCTFDGQRLYCPLVSPCCLCACGGAWAAACGQTGQVAVYSGARLKNVFFVCPGACGMLLSPWQNALYVLSGETDTLYRASLGAGEVELGTRAGFAPRHLCRRGSVLAVAGGGSGQAILMNDELQTLASADFDGCVWQCAFGAGSRVYALCAVENGEVDAAVYCWRGKEKRLLCRLPGLPGGMLLSGKTLLVSTLNRLFCLDAFSGKTLWARGQPGLLKGFCISCGAVACTDECNEQLLCGADKAYLHRMPFKNVKAAGYV